MLTEYGLPDCRKTAEEVPMNNDLMRDENFIRCSTLIAELLMKYKKKENEESGESSADSQSSPILIVLSILGLIYILSLFIISFT